VHAIIPLRRTPLVSADPKRAIGHLPNGRSPYAFPNPEKILATLEPFFNQSALTAFIHSIDTSIENSPDSPFRCPAADCSVSIALNLHRLRQVLLKRRQVDRLAVEEVCASLLAESVASVDQRRAVVRQPMRAVTRQAHRDLVDATRVVLAQKFRDKLSLGDIAQAVFSSPFHLARIFCRETGVSLPRHLTSLRLRHALAVSRTINTLSY
jgi:AraC family transcriptional regulator